MICARCGAAAAEGRRFCGDCGSPLPWKCRTCGGENAADKRFCGDCGSPLVAGSAGPLQAPAPANASTPSTVERRLLTVMFVDLIGSTSLGTRLDPEDLRDVIVAFHGLVAAVITQFSGFIARYMGDGVLVYFGYPHAHEDDPERAVRAGLAVVEGVRRLATVAGPAGTLGSRVGIASGLVVVGDLIGFGASLESAAVGDTPNLAARLQAAADPNTVVISEATHGLVGGLFEYQKLGLGVLKGRSAPERAWEVLGESATDNRFEALRRGQVPLVDRTEELDLLVRRWDQIKTGEGRVVMIAGEPGIGKSRLAMALEQKIPAGSFQRIRFTCSPHHRDTPLYPVIRHIERRADFQRGDAPAVKREKLRRTLPTASSPDDTRLLADLLSIPDPADKTPDSLSPQRRKEMTFAAILRQFEALASRTPILAVLEDMHWADPTTLGLLDLLVEHAERLPMLLIVTTRPGVAPGWSSRSNVTVQHLNGFDRRFSAALVKEVIFHQSLPKDVVDRIIAHADGVPLFIEELTKTVLDRDFHKDRDAGPTGDALLPDAVPTSLQASLMARLDRLSLGKEMAQTAAVIGRDFSFEILQALSQSPAPQIERALGELVEAGLVIARGRPPNATYTFKHALLQDAAYASLLRDRRRAIHRRVAEILEEGAAGMEARHPQVIAWHFSEAGLADRALAHYLQAAEQTTGRFALAEMTSHLRNALRELHKLPESAERTRRELSLLVSLGRALIDHLGSGSEEVRATFERAREVSLALDHPDQLVRVHDGLLNFHFTHSETERIILYADELVSVGQRAESRHALLMARRSAGFAHLLAGRLIEAREEMQRFLAMYDLARDGPESGLTTRDPKVSVCTILGICLTALGLPESGAAISLEGLRHAARIDHVVSLVLGLRRACVARMMQRDRQGVADLARELASVSTQYETFKGSRDGVIFQAWASFRPDGDASLLTRAQDCIAHFDTTRHWALLPFFMASIAELEGEAGDIAGAVKRLERAAELVNTTGERWCEAEILRLQARFCTTTPDERLDLLFASLEKAKAQCAKLWELRAAIDLATLWRGRGEQAAARDTLAPVYSWFSEGLETPDLIAARTLLSELNAA
ncbi:MAG TPA: AAA family ATPase [Acetobacteraceae bacterium]|nr:AAA family ATPase [Acetobacteraceae bacterium]